MQKNIFGGKCPYLSNGARPNKALERMSAPPRCLAIRESGMGHSSLSLGVRRQNTPLPSDQITLGQEKKENT